MAAKRQIALARPSTGDEEWHAAREPLASGWLTQGPLVAAFESEFAARHGADHAVATTSGTTALHLALAVLGIGEGDEVIIPAFTWVATANAVLQTGATPVVVDVDPATFNVTADAVSRARTAATKAVIPVHLFGLCADTNAIRRALPDIPIIEDAACAAGATLRGVSAGAQGDLAAFSFHPRKTITTGEGGMLTTNDAELADRARVVRNHGASAGASGGPEALPEFAVLGFNYRMTDLQAAVGRVQLGKLDRFVDERQQWAAHYRRRLRDVGWLRLPEAAEGSVHAWQSFVCRIDPSSAPATRNQIINDLAIAGISTRPGTTAIFALRYHAQRLQLSAADFPGARECYEQSMALPLHNEMVEEDFDYVIEQLHAL